MRVKSFGEKRFGEKRFGGKRFGGKRFGEKRFGEKRFWEKCFGENAFWGERRFVPTMVSFKMRKKKFNLTLPNLTADAYGSWLRRAVYKLQPNAPWLYLRGGVEMYLT